MNKTTNITSIGIGRRKSASATVKLLPELAYSCPDVFARYYLGEAGMCSVVWCGVV